MSKNNCVYVILNNSTTTCFYFINNYLQYIHIQNKYNYTSQQIFMHTYKSYYEFIIIRSIRWHIMIKIY